MELWNIHGASFMPGARDAESGAGVPELSNETGTLPRDRIPAAIIPGA
jgi:hypothetical protein